MTTEQTTQAPELCWSADKENFQYDDLCDLLDSNDQIGVGATVWFGEKHKVEAREIIDIDDILEMMRERASDIVGEWADDYPDITKIATEELRVMLYSWIEKHCKPNFYSVENSKKYIVTDEDMEGRS